jgi:hypothetical protein
MRKLLARLFGLVEQRQEVEERLQEKAPMLECPNCGSMSGAKTHFGCMVTDFDWIATCRSCGHRWGPGMEKYSNLLP